MRVYSEAIKAAPANPGVRLEAAGVLQDMGAPFGAEVIAGTRTPSIAADQAAAMVRWGARVRSSDPTRRFADAALARLDQLLAALPPPPAEAGLRRRLRLDRMVALRDRVRMREAAEEGEGQRLMLSLSAPGPPPEWADVGLLPQSRDAAETAGLARRLRAEGWLRPDAAGRVAFALPAEPRLQVEALRQAQRHGASAFALCPDQPELPPAPALSAAFSAATYPYRP